MKTKKLEDKVAIVTGGGFGLGREMAIAMAQEGANIIIAAPISKQNKEVAHEIKTLGRKAMAVTTDVTKEKQVNNMVQTALEEFGKIDILVNNAGGPLGTSGRSLWNLSLKEWKTVIDVNLMGAFLCSKAVLNTMINQKRGTIINITSGMKPVPNYATYVAAKSGLEALSKSLAAEVAPFNVRVNLLSPGGAAATHPKPPGSQITVRLKPEVIRQACIYLASDDSAGINGQCINAVEWNEEHGLGTFSDYVQAE